jgi:hypothetical protein
MIGRDSCGNRLDAAPVPSRRRAVMSLAIEAKIMLSRRARSSTANRSGFSGSHSSCSRGHTASGPSTPTIATRVPPNPQRPAAGRRQSAERALPEAVRQDGDGRRAERVILRRERAADARGDAEHSKNSFDT